MKRISYFSLQHKIRLVVIVSMLVILVVDFIMFRLWNQVNQRVEAVYTSNITLNNLDERLTSLDNNMNIYVSTKSSDAMEAYFRDEQELRTMVSGLNTQILDDPYMIAEKNIHHMFNSYLGITAQIIQAKRGRKVELYAELSQQASELSSQIHVCIRSLNSQQFKSNSETYSSLTRRIATMESNMEFMMVIILIVDTLLVSLLTSLIIKPLQNLAHAADEMAAGNLEVEAVPVKSMDEIGILTVAFNQMVSSIRNYIRQTRENLIREQELREKELLMEGHLKDAQLKYLQAQIDPHFLFNTLNAGAQLAMMEGAEKTEELLDNTAAFFRYNVRRNKQEATIREEIDLVENYIYICKARFGDTFIFEKEIDESLVEQKIPSMIIQPLIENAFKYGIRDLEEMGRMELSIYRRGADIFISVWDNGAGMTQERIQQVLAGHADQTPNIAQPESNGVGMWNVMERLRLYFDGEARFDINSEGPGTGTEVLIRIPGKWEDE